MLLLLTITSSINKTIAIAYGIHLLILTLENIYFLPNVNDKNINAIIITKYRITDNMLPIV